MTRAQPADDARRANDAQPMTADSRKPIADSQEDLKDHQMNAAPFDLKRLAARVGSYVVLLVFTLIAIYPVTRIITISLRPGDRLLSTSLALIPDDATLDNYRELLFETPFLRWLFNSILVSLVVTVTGVAFAST